MSPEIRLASAADAPAVAAIYAPFCANTPTSFEVVPPTADEIAGRIARITASLPWLVLDDAGAIAGYAYASRHRERAAYQWAVDLAVYIHPDFLRRGAGRALYTALFDVLRLQNYFKAYGGITLPNPGSIGLHEAMGFTLVGVYESVGYKLGAWHDVAWYALTLQPERVEPQPPRPLAEVCEAPGWREALDRGLREYRRGAVL
jgi:L-amino acid N-acyltransferase YncA